MTAGSTTGAPPTPPNEERRRLVSWSRRNAVLAGAVLALIVAVAIAVGYRRGSERRRTDALLKASLDRIVTAQEGFYYDSTRYTVALRALPAVKLPPGVHVQLFSPDRRSWWGIATHDQSPRRRCVVWVGAAPSVLPLDARSPEDETKPLCYDATQLGGLSRHS